MLILITGTSRGIGRGLAEQLLTKGHEVLGCSRGPGPELGEKYKHYSADLMSTDQIARMFASVREQYGFLDALINNAGTASMNPFLLTSPLEVERLFRLNVFAVLCCCREAAKLMRHSRHTAPSIINLSSVAVQWSIPGQSAYASSKSAVEQVTRTASYELAPFNVRINTVSLPPMRTALTRSVSQAKIAALIERQAFRRTCEINDIVGPIEFLLSAAAHFVTGTTLNIGGVD
jgi:3-oxoacyl-[acyl-carrier protein] reductase